MSNNDKKIFHRKFTEIILRSKFSLSKPDLYSHHKKIKYRQNFNETYNEIVSALQL